MELFILSAVTFASVVGLSYYGLWIAGFAASFALALILSKHWIASFFQIGVLHGILLCQILEIAFDTDLEIVWKTELSTFISLVPLAFGGAKGMLLVGACVGSIVGALYSIPYRDGAELDGRREWRWFRERLFWRIIQSMFKLQVVFENPKHNEIPFDSEGMMFCVSPHGLFNFGGILSAAFHGGQFPDFPRPYCAVTSVVFSIPLIADIAKWGGCIDARREIVAAKLKEGKHVGLAPGGVQEMIVQRSHEVDLYLGHEGFLTLALENGFSIIPVYCHGENRIFLTWSRWPKVQRFFAKRILYPFPAIYLGPFREPLTVFVGNPIKPSHDMTDAYVSASGKEKEEERKKIVKRFKTAYYSELGRIILDRETYPINAGLKSYLEDCISNRDPDAEDVLYWNREERRKSDRLVRF